MMFAFFSFDRNFNCTFLLVARSVCVTQVLEVSYRVTQLAW